MKISFICHPMYMSVDSAMLLPMTFKKSLSMSQDLEIQQSRYIDNHYILVVNLTKSNWDWDNKDDELMGNPAYYLRYYKTFN